MSWDDADSQAPKHVTSRDGATPPGLARRRLRRGVAWLGLRGVALVVLVPLVFAALLPLLIIGQEITAPSWIKARVEAQAASVLAGGALTFGEISVEIGRDLHPVIRIRDAELRDADDSLLARVPQIAAQVSPRGLILQREVLAQSIRLTGAEIALRRNADGRVAVAFDGAGRFTEADSLVGLIESFDAVFARPALAALEDLQVVNLVVSYADARAQRTWLVDGGTLTLDLTGGVTRLNADLAVLSGRSYVTTLRIGYESARDSPQTRLEVALTDVAARDVATQNPALAWLGLLDARVSAQLRGGTLADGTLAPLTAEIDIGAGALRPARGAEPLPFEAIDAEIAFLPAAGRIGFSRLAVTSDLGRLVASGHADIAGMTSGLPEVLVGQFEIADLSLAAGGVVPVPIEVRDGFADFRLTLDPFGLELGQFGLTDGTGARAPRLLGSGRVAADGDGWRVAIDAGVDRIGQAHLMSRWPDTLRPRTRAWIAENMAEAVHRNLSVGVRIAPGAPTRWALSESFETLTVTPLHLRPDLTQAAGTLTIQQDALALRLDAGRMEMPDGGAVDLAGSSFAIPDLGAARAPAITSVAADGSLTALLSFLDLPPWEFLSRAGQPVSVAQGRIAALGSVTAPLAGGAAPGEVAYGFDGVVRGLRSEVLIPGRVLTSDRLDLRVTASELRLSGPVQLDGIAADAVWTQPLGPDAGPGVVHADVRLDPAGFAALGIVLPRGMVTGTGQGALTLTLARGDPVRFRLTSDLRGLALALPQLGWSKGAGTAGAFEISGEIGAAPGTPPRIDRIALTAPGLEAAGDIVLRAGGGLDRLRLPQVRLGGWLSASVTLIGHGAGQPPEIRVDGGAVDLRRAAFAQSGGPGDGPVGGQGGGPGAAMGPLTLALDRLDVADGIYLTNFDGTFDGNGGFNGRFRGLLGGAARVGGVVAPIGAGLGVRVLSDDAGAVLAASGLLRTAAGGTLDLTLTPVNGSGPGSYDGVARIAGLHLVRAPALARLLDAISVVGLVQQLGGQGLIFDDVDVAFRLAPDRITVTQASAVGPGLGISADGTYSRSARTLDFQGVVSPIYLLNGIGSVLTRPGEGLFGFNFTVTGPVSDAGVSVNPLSVLTPGMFREIFRRPVPVVD